MTDTQRERLTVSVSPKRKLTKKDLGKFALNFLIFTAPFLAVFFKQLEMGVDPKAAFLVAVIVLWGLFADLFSKWAQKKYYN